MRQVAGDIMGAIAGRVRRLREEGAYSVLLRPHVVLNDAIHQRERNVRPEVMRSRPTHVEIEVTNRCNLACIQCLRSQGLKPYDLGDVSPSDFARILAQFPEALHVCLNGFGEPLMHPRFFDLVAHTRQRLPWAKISIYTNGILLDAVMAERVLLSDLSEINVSIDAAFPETYRKVRRGGQLDVVHRNLCNLVERRAEVGGKKPLVGVNFVMLNENEGELVPFIEQAAEARVDFVNCVSYATYDWGFRNRRDPDSYRRELEAGRRRLEELGLEARVFPSADIGWADPARRFDCAFPWGDTVRVTFQGEVTLGCCTPFKETYSYGNLLKTPFADLWNGPLFRYNRTRTRDGVAPNPVCASCHAATTSFFQLREEPRAKVVRLPLAPRDGEAGAPAALSAALVLVNPPPLPGRTNERTFSGGIGVSRRLKPLEREQPTILPIDFLYLAAVAEKAGARIALADLVVERLRGSAAERACAERIAAVERPGVATYVGVRLSMPSLAQDLAFANRVKALHPACIVFVFGSVIMATLDHWVESARVDYACFGEPEVFFHRVLRGDAPASIDGWIDLARYVPLRGDDRYDEAQVAARLAKWVTAPSLSELPRPAWHLLEMARYAPAGRGASEVGAFVQASRGCPLNCTMCPYALLEGDTWRSNDIDRVVSEVEYLNRTFGIYRVRFRDPNFGFKRKYALDLAEALIARGVKLAATIESSVEVFDEETLRALRRAGVDTITTGVETNDDACMQSIGQTIRINDKLRKRVALCHDLGFRVYGTYCLGTPEETWDTVEKTWRFARELDVESTFTVMTPFPGTAMYWRALREGLLPRRMQFSSWNSYSSTVRTYALTTADLDMARWWARMETILPYRRKRAAAEGVTALAGFYVKHSPHYAWRSACRLYVKARRRFPATKLSAVSAPRSAP
jgi:MoaA/NifB/PqqE/SkfB family radical SAM enzyme